MCSTTTTLSEVAKSIKNPTEISVLSTPLDSDLYDLTEEETAFFKTLTKIEDDAALKKHILDVQGDAYKVGITYGVIDDLEVVLIRALTVNAI